jgi:hypothetical protein
MPIMPRDWSEPFLEQAREDLKAAWSLANATPLSASTLCMLIQMVFEKLAKAAFAKGGNVDNRNHQVASRVFPLIQRASPAGVHLVRNSPNVIQFVFELETAHPFVANRAEKDDPTVPWPRLEYPWPDPTASVVLSPAHNLALAQRVRCSADRIAADCLKFASAFAKDFHNIIP